MHLLKHLHFKPQKLRFNNFCFNICDLFILLYLISLVHCKTFNDFTNLTNLNENFKYDKYEHTIYHQAPNSITSFQLLKNNHNLNVNSNNCGCPPKGQFSHSDLDIPEDIPCLFNIKDVAQYVCKSGYIKANGSEKLTCVLNDGKAEWSGKPLNCKIITCSDPGEVAHAKRVVKDPNFSYNSQVSYQCHTNYMSDSKPIILCDRNGQWNRKLPVCKLIQCPHLTELDPKLYFSYTDPDRKVNSTVNFQCKSGFHLDNEDNHFRQCEWNGNWTGSNPTCIPNYCEIPDNLVSDLVIIPKKERYEPGEKINYRCKSNKKYTTTECQLSGDFHLQIDCLKSKKTHCPLVELQNGQVNSSAQDEFIIGAQLTFKCNENYVLNEENVKIHCLHSGEWSASPPRCIDLATIRTSQILSYILTCIIIILVLIITITVILLFRWRQKQLQKREWQRYFYNLEYQHCDKRKVQNNSSQEMHIIQAQRISLPFTDL